MPHASESEGVHCRIKELASTLNSQYNAAAELRRNLEAEAALHTNKVSWLRACPFLLYRNLDIDAAVGLLTCCIQS